MITEGFRILAFTSVGLRLIFLRCVHSFGKLLSNAYGGGKIKLEIQKWKWQNCYPQETCNPLSYNGGQLSKVPYLWVFRDLPQLQVLCFYCSWAIEYLTFDVRSYPSKNYFLPPRVKFDFRWYIRVLTYNFEYLNLLKQWWFHFRKVKDSTSNLICLKSKWREIPGS